MPHFYLFPSYRLKTARANTELYDDAFLVVPTDRVRTVEECHAYEQRTPLAEFDRTGARRMLKGVKVRSILSLCFTYVNQIGFVSGISI